MCLEEELLHHLARTRVEEEPRLANPSPRSAGFAALRLPFGLPFGREHFVVVIRPHPSIRIFNPLKMSVICLVGERRRVISDCKSLYSFSAGLQIPPNGSTSWLLRGSSPAGVSNPTPNPLPFGKGEGSSRIAKLLRGQKPICKKSSPATRLTTRRGATYSSQAGWRPSLIAYSVAAAHRFLSASMILASISSANSGLSSTICLAASRPWPSFEPS